MGHDSSNTGLGREAQKRLVMLVALLAMLFHVAAPLATALSLSRVAGGRADGLYTTIICSGGEAREVTFDKDGKPVRHTPGQHTDCTYCIHHCAAAMLVSIAALPALQYVPEAQPLHSAALIAALIGTANSRAPPR